MYSTTRSVRLGRWDVQLKISFRFQPTRVGPAVNSDNYGVPNNSINDNDMNDTITRHENNAKLYCTRRITR